SAVNSVTGSVGESEIADIILDDINNTFFAIFLNEGKVWSRSQEEYLPPIYLNAISDIVISENASEQTVNLSGIAASGLGFTHLRVTATSSNTSLIPDPVTSYSSPDSVGSLTFTPVANQSGFVTITVTILDGGLDRDLGTTGDNNTFQRTFDVTVTTLVDIDLRVVNSPTEVQSNGEVSVLPDHENRVNEWSSFWVEIWVDTTNAASQGIFSTTLGLNYHTEYVSATSIEYGAGFTENQTGTINDPGGAIENLSAETNVTNLGISEYLLFARVKFESLADDSVDIDIANQMIGPYDLEFSISSPEVSLVSSNPVQTNLSPFEGTSIWANPFDLNDNDMVDFRDLILFASVYHDIPSESSNDYAWFSDYNQNDQVEFRDLILFASNYRKSKAGDSALNYPADFPDAWGDPLLVSMQPQTKMKTANLTQGAAEQVLEKAIEQVSEQFTPEMNQSLSGIEVKVVDLSGATLGRAVPGTIYLDVNAAGYGWFVDSTPLDHSEFAVDSQLSLIALPESAAAGRIDLWTVILHELGHLVGYEHESAGLMEETLSPGVRKLSAWNADSDLFFASVQEEAELLPF
ncbi:MAG: hypothetical protein KDA77_05005, partial [Planctomycetaceae bacterium]|nr:hypothetical protein [Planctomycetaceae bacterium]